MLKNNAIGEKKSRANHNEFSQYIEMKKSYCSSFQENRKAKNYSGKDYILNIVSVLHNYLHWTHILVVLSMLE